jgi:hypothetical protein
MGTSLLISLMLVATPSPLSTISTQTPPVPAPVLPWRVAAPNWRVVNTRPELADFYADRLAQALRKQGVQVVTSNEIAAALSSERQKQLLGCTEESSSCLVELGNALGVDGTLMVSFARLDESSYEANVKVISSSTGKVIAETRASGDSEKKMLTALDEAAMAVAVDLETLRPSDSAPPPSTVRSRAWVAAAGGAVFIATGAGLFVGAHNTYAQENQVLNNGAIIEEERVRQARALAVEGKRTQALAWTGVGIGIGALAGAGLMYWLGDKSPVMVQTVITPGGMAFGIGGELP